jgi:methionyl-tRNA formyltransferase
MEVREPAVKVAARRLGLPVHQPVKVRTGNLHEWLRDLRPDVAIVLAYGRILPRPVLDAPRHGCLNLHASILPRYRGAAPIQWALMRGETETGISLMQMDDGLDTGPVLRVRRITIDPDDDAGRLSERLAELAAVMVREDLGPAVDGTLVPVPQDDSLATLAPPLTREHGRIDWTRPAREIVAQVRGLSPRPGAYTLRAGRALKVLAAAVGEGPPLARGPGTVVRADRGGLWVVAADGVVDVRRAQLEGKRAMDAGDLVNGRALQLGDVLGT